MNSRRGGSKGRPESPREECTSGIPLLKPADPHPTARCSCTPHACTQSQCDGMDLDLCAAVQSHPAVVAADAMRTKRSPCVTNLKALLPPSAVYQTAASAAPLVTAAGLPVGSAVLTFCSSLLRFDMSDCCCVALCCGTPGLNRDGTFLRTPRCSCGAAVAAPRHAVAGAAVGSGSGVRGLLGWLAVATVPPLSAPCASRMRRLSAELDLVAATRAARAPADMAMDRSRMAALAGLLLLLLPRRVPAVGDRPVDGMAWAGQCQVRLKIKGHAGTPDWLQLPSRGGVKQGTSPRFSSAAESWACSLLCGAQGCQRQDETTAHVTGTPLQSAMLSQPAAQPGRLPRQPCQCCWICPTCMLP